MCIQCHSHISDEELIKSFKNVKNAEFIQWNTTSVSHIIIAALGMNGPNARELAIDILERFIEWRNTQPENYIPYTGLEKMRSVDSLKKDLEYIKNNFPDYLDKHSIITNYSEYIKNM